MARIGVFVCECGSNISEKVDVLKVLDAVGAMEEVVVAEPYRLLCSADGKSYLEERIRKEGLTHVVVAACSPRDHQQTFEGVCDRAGVNPYLMQLVNIREQCAWVTQDPVGATEKAIRMIRAAVGRVRYQAPLERKDLAINPDVLVLGGGLAGMQASLRLSGKGRRVYLVEREDELGGTARLLQHSYPDMADVPRLLADTISRVKEDKDVEVLLGHRLEQLVGFSGNFEATLRPPTEGSAAMKVKVGALVVATGAQPFDPSTIRGYGEGRTENVLSAPELEAKLRAGKVALADGRAPRSVALIHCAGREVKGYCSEICCAYGLKLSSGLKTLDPEVQAHHLYSQLCIPGKAQQRFYEDTLSKGVRMLRCADVRVRKGPDGPQVDFIGEDGTPASLGVDMVVLLPALEPRRGAEDLAKVLGVSLDKWGFFAKQHELLVPVVSDREGVLLAGSAGGPKGLSESLTEAQAAAGKVLATLVPGRRIEIEAKTSRINESTCQGCGTCVAVCPFSAITLDPRRRIAVVNEAICRGCGSCAAACPSGAAVVRHFTYDQIYQEIAEALR